MFSLNREPIFRYYHQSCEDVCVRSRWYACVAGGVIGGVANLSVTVGELGRTPTGDRVPYELLSAHYQCEHYEQT